MKRYRKTRPESRPQRTRWHAHCEKLHKERLTREYRDRTRNWVKEGYEAFLRAERDLGRRT